MKHARIAWAGAIHDAVESEGQLLLTRSPWADKRLSFDEVVLVATFAASTAGQNHFGFGIELRRPRQRIGVQSARRAFGVCQRRGLAHWPQGPHTQTARRDLHAL